MAKFKLLFILIFLGIFFSCNKTTKSKAISISKTTKKTDSKSDELINNNSVIDGSIGVITTSNKYEFGDIITVFDSTKKVSNEIKIQDEYKILVLPCLSKEEFFFKVRLEDGQIGYISNKSKKIVFESWEHHILNLFSVGFDFNSNPILKSPVRNSDKLNFDKNEFYFPNKIEGEWLQLKWGSENNLNYGWIRWKENDQLIIEFFYFA